MSFFRLRKRLSLGPIHLNVSKTGASLTVLTALATHNLPLFGRKRSRRATIDLPGTGISYVVTKSHKRSHK